MKPIFELHVSCVDDGQTPQFRIAPVGAGAAEETVHLSIEDARLLSVVLDQLSRRPSNGLRPARRS